MMIMLRIILRTATDAATQVSCGSVGFTPAVIVLGVGIGQPDVRDLPTLYGEGDRDRKLCIPVVTG